MTGLCQKCLDSMTYENMVPRWKNWKKGVLDLNSRFNRLKRLLRFIIPPFLLSPFFHPFHHPSSKRKERFIKNKPKDFGKGFSCGEVLKPTENRRLTMCECLRMLYLIGYGRPLAFQQFRCLEIYAVQGGNFQHLR